MIAGLKSGIYAERSSWKPWNSGERYRIWQKITKRSKVEKLKSEIFTHVDGGRTRQDADELNFKTETSKIGNKKKYFQPKNSQEMERNTGRNNKSKKCGKL
jgi:hypothetical protein